MKIKYLLHGAFMTMIYFQFRDKVGVYVIENDFKDVFPEVFYPWKERYRPKDIDETMIECLLSLKKNDKEDIVKRRKLK